VITRRWIVIGAIALLIAVTTWWFLLRVVVGQEFAAGGVSFRYPEGWLLEENRAAPALDGLIASVRIEPEGGGGKVDVLVLEREPIAPADVQTVMTGHLNSYWDFTSGGMSSARVIQPPVRQDVNGHVAYRSTARVTTGGRATTHRVAIVRGADTYSQITCEYDGDHERVVLEACGQVLGSFQLP
jgi:hypothetical protein